MDKKTKTNILLAVAFIALAALIFFIVKMTKNNTDPTAASTEATTVPATANTVNTTDPYTTTEITNPETGIGMSETEDPNKYITGEGGTGSLTELDYYPSMNWFKNSGTYSGTIEGPYGSFELTVGTDSAIDKAIVLNPTTNYPDKNVTIGYITWGSTGFFYCGEEPYVNVKDVASGETDFWIDRTYDQLQSAKHVNDAANYGLVWIESEHEAPEHHLGMLIMDVKKRRVLGIAAIDVVMENDQYRIAGVRDAQCQDVDTVELLTAIYKNDILNSRSLILADGDVDNAVIFIERLDDKSTYFGTYKKPGVSLMQSSRILNYPIYAVTMNNESFGPITFYYEVKQSVGDKPIKFEYVGQDLINIRTQEDLHN